MALSAKPQCSRQMGPGCLQRAFSRPAKFAQPGHTAASRGDVLKMSASSAPPASAGKIINVKDDCSDLLALTETWIKNGGYFGPFTDASIEMMDEDFVFRGPLAGPLIKKSYITVLSAVAPYVPFPDFQSNAFGFCNDPQNPYRVFFYVRETGTHTETWKFPGLPFDFEPTNKPILTAPSVYSVIWTPERKVQYISVGYAVDRIVSDAVDGSMTVALFNLLKTANVPVPTLDGGPVTTAIFNILGAIQGDSDFGVTPYEKLPAWFRAYPNAKLVGPAKF